MKSALHFWSLALGLVWGLGGSPTPAKADPSVSPPAEPKEVYGPYDTLSPGEGQALWERFQAALANSRKAFRHRSDLQRREMLKSLEARKTRWFQQEDERAAEYKRLNPGVKTEEYFRQAQVKRADFLKALQEEQDAFESSWKAKSEKLEKDLEWRAREAKRVLNEGHRPPRELWP